MFDNETPAQRAKRITEGHAEHARLKAQRKAQRLRVAPPKLPADLWDEVFGFIQDVATGCCEQTDLEERADELLKRIRA